MDLLLSDGGQPGGMEQTLTGQVALHLFSEGKDSYLRQLLATCALWLALLIPHIYEMGEPLGSPGAGPGFGCLLPAVESALLREGRKLYFRSWQGAGFGSWLCLFFCC